MLYVHPLFVVVHLATLIIGNFAGRQYLCIIYHQVIMLTMLFVVVLFLFHSSLFRGLFLIRPDVYEKYRQRSWAFPSLHSGQAFRSNLPAKREGFSLQSLMQKKKACIHLQQAHSPTLQCQLATTVCRQPRFKK